MTVMTYSQASRRALQEEMRRDPRVWALGEDIGPEGGTGGQYKGLQAEFGRDRIFDTPISESTIMGVGVGAAMVGTRPVIEMRYADMALCAVDEIINQAAKMRYMTGGQARVPVVIRQSIGFRGGNGAHHSLSSEAIWVHTPGLVVVAPATVADNRTLLKASIRCDDPVIYLEHKDLALIEGDVPEHEEAPELGKALIRHSGDDVTIVTWAKGVHISAQAATALALEGIGADVIDLRTLWPWDRAMVFESVRRTRRLIVAHESVEIGGFGGEVVAEVSRHLFNLLKAPPLRLGIPRVTLPFAENLETLCRLDPARITSAAKELLAYRR
jgi:pyruvate/2-oxoglutarate/acetoin dehydrogenase E1 component